MDADNGATRLNFREIYQRRGMTQLLERSDDSNYLLRKHLDLREIPILLEDLRDNQGNPLTYIGCTESHAIAVVDNTVHDNQDSSTIGDRLDRETGRLVELWVRTDDEQTLEAAREVLRKYEEVAALRRRTDLWAQTSLVDIATSPFCDCSAFLVTRSSPSPTPDLRQFSLGGLAPRWLRQWYARSGQWKRSPPYGVLLLHRC